MSFWTSQGCILRSNTDKHLLNTNLIFIFLCRKLKEDKEEIEEQRRLRQEEEERSLVTVSFFKKCVVSKNNCFSKLSVECKSSDIIQEENCFSWSHTKVQYRNAFYDLERDMYCQGKIFHILLEYTARSRRKCRHEYVVFVLAARIREHSFMNSVLYHCFSFWIAWRAKTASPSRGVMLH